MTHNTPTVEDITVTFCLGEVMTTTTEALIVCFDYVSNSKLLCKTILKIASLLQFTPPQPKSSALAHYTRF